MKGHLVKLRAIEEEDYSFFSKWMIPSTLSALARGTQDFASTDEIKKDIQSGNTRYAMVLTHENKKIGFVSWQPQKYEGSYILGGIIGEPELWDNGCGAEASLLLMDYLFHSKNAHKVQFVNGLYNARSVRFLLKNKVVIEGILRDHFFVDGEYHDAVISSILREEYYADSHNQPQDAISKIEKVKIQEELYEYMNGYWKENCFPTLVKKNG